MELFGSDDYDFDGFYNGDYSNPSKFDIDNKTYMGLLFFNGSYDDVRKFNQNNIVYGESYVFASDLFW